MLLGPVETCPDAASPQIKAASTDVAPSDFSSTSPGHETAGNAPIESSNPSKYASRRRAADPEIIQRVEEVVHQIALSLQQEDDDISIALRTRKRSGNPPRANKSQSSSHDQYKLSFPGKTPEEAWRFSTAGLTETVCSRISSMLTCSPAVVLRILELIHEALVSNVVVSKRCVPNGTSDTLHSIAFLDNHRLIRTAIETSTIRIRSFSSRRKSWTDTLIFSATPLASKEQLSTSLVDSPATIPESSYCTYIDDETATAKGLVAGSFMITFHDSSTSSCNSAANVHIPAYGCKAVEANSSRLRSLTTWTTSDLSIS